MIRHAVGAAVLAASLLPPLVGCGAADRPHRLNVLILSLDTTRGDRFGCYGYDIAKTPRLDAFAAERAVLFENALTAVPLTLPSHTTIMTGTYPVFHGVHDNDGFFVDDRLTSIAEIVGDHGYTTGAVVASFPLDSQFNIDQGFQTYNDDLKQDWTESEIESRTDRSFGFVERTADLVNAAAFRWLEEHDKETFFLWMHYFDPHQAYDPPKPYNSQFNNHYDGEIAFVDENFGDLLDFLDSRGLLDTTIIVVVGDHGESLDEHGEPTHGTYVYDAPMQVPLLIAVPGDGFAKGERAFGQVRTIDIAPTILDLLGLPKFEEMQGTSLVPMLRDPSVRLGQPALLESHFGQYQFGWAPLRALRTDDWKYVLAPEPELYDLQADPEELYNLAPSRPEVVAELDAQLAELAAELSSPEVARSAATHLDPEVTARLVALGYLGSSGTSVRAEPFPTKDSLATMTNPIDRTFVLRQANVLNELLRSGNYDDALMVAHNALATDPDNYRLRFLLAETYMLLQQYDKALPQYEWAARIDPSAAGPWAIMGRIHYAYGRFDEAEQALERAVQLEPNRVEALQNLALSQARRGDFDGSIKRLEQALAVDENKWTTWLRLGRVQGDSGRLEEARASFEHALHLNPYSPEVLHTIGLFYLQLENFEFSRTTLEQAARVAPDVPIIRFHLAEAILGGGGDPQQAREQLERVIALAPESGLAESARRKLAETDGMGD